MAPNPNVASERKLIYPVYALGLLPPLQPLAKRAARVVPPPQFGDDMGRGER